MRKSKDRTRVFKSDHTREWATDFLIGIGMFVLVAFFASSHTDPALPAPLEKIKTVHEQTITTPAQGVSTRQMATTRISSSGMATAERTQPTGNRLASFGNNNNIIMIFMALVFSALLTLTIQFWRNLRRAYASPRRKWGRG